MTTAIIKFTATAELNLDSDTFPRGMTNEEKLAYWLEGASMEPLLALACVDAEWKIDGNLKPLTSAPIPPSDVADEVERWKEAAADLGGCFDSASKRIAELERKRAEQTALADKYAHEVIELTKLLEESKRQAVPEGWKLVPIEPTDSLIAPFVKHCCENPAWVKQAWREAMLSAAPQPNGVDK